MVLDSAEHFLITEKQRLMTSVAVVCEIVREKDIEFCFDIIVVHLM